MYMMNFLSTVIETGSRGERDSWKTAAQAVEYGLIDKVISAQ